MSAGRTPLTRDAVLRAAVAVADEEGVVALSMRKVAARLGVEAMSLYHHVANKDAILDGLVDLVFAEIQLPTRDQDWRDAMRERAASTREVLNRHPWAVAFLDSRTGPGPATLRHHDAVIGSLRRGGFDIAGAAQAFAVIDAFVYGFVVQEQALPFDDAGGIEEVAEGLREQLLPDEYPYLVEMMVDHALQPGYSYAEEFWNGLDLILDGLERVCRGSLVLGDAPGSL